MRTITISIAIAAVVAASAAAQPSAPHAEWFAGPVKHLMTKEEISGWKTVRTDAEAQAFIDLFWARRDPTPATPRNEFREEFEVRVALADRHFTTLKTRGAMSDRGRVLILLGPPSLMGGTGAGRVAEPDRNPVRSATGVVDLAGPRPISARMVWTYLQDKKPVFAKRKELEILFVDDRGGGEWEIARTERIDPERILQDAIKHYVVSPEMTQAPVFDDATAVAGVRSTSFRDELLKSAYDAFRAGQTTPSPAFLSWGEFVTPAGKRFVPIQLYVPAKAGIQPGREMTFFGVVEKDGEVVEVHENRVTLSANRADAFADKTLVLDPGTYTATFGLADEGRIVTIAKTAITVEGLEPRASGISQLYLSNNILALQEAYGPDHPFVFGGLKVISKGDAVFTPSDNLWYFVELRNPALADGAPKIQVKVDIEGKTDGRNVRMSLPRQDADIARLKGVEDRYAVGSAIALETVPPGDYTIKVQLFDTVLNRKYDLRRDFRVRATASQ